MVRGNILVRFGIVLLSWLGCTMILQWKMLLWWMTDGAMRLKDTMEDITRLNTGLFLSKLLILRESTNVWLDHKWEENSGIDVFSYGYNRNSNLTDYLSAAYLVNLLVRTVSFTFYKSHDLQGCLWWQFAVGCWPCKIVIRSYWLLGEWWFHSCHHATEIEWCRWLAQD
jgi:hypothetical protein